MLEHNQGVAWSMRIFLDDTFVGVASEQGNGGAPTFCPDQVVSDSLGLTWSESKDRFRQINMALIELGSGKQYSQGHDIVDYDVMAYLEPIYEGAPMTLLDALTLMRDPAEQLSGI
jgi:hypothetical protein